MANKHMERYREMQIKMSRRYTGTGMAEKTYVMRRMAPKDAPS